MLQNQNIAETEYVSNVLLNGGKLSNQIHSGINFHEGVFRCVPPVQKSSWTVGRFYEGGVWAESENDHEREESVGRINTEIEEFLQHPGRFGVFQHTVALPSDGWLHKTRLEYCTNGEEIYFPICSGEIDKVASWLRATPAWPPFVCLFCDFGALETPFSEQIVKGEFGAIVGNVRKILFRAFDGEGFLWWEPRKQSDLA